MSTHPYKSLPPERFWRKSVAAVPPFALDPLLPGSFEIRRTDRVATAGSCFAQHVSRALQRGGFDFLCTEPNDEGLSARYGNVYTTRQFLQLVERALGLFTPTIEAWDREDGRFVDPLRPGATPDGFATPDEVESERAIHLGHVREMIRTLDVLVFTLGLTEGWRNLEDGSALPLPPGAAGGSFDPARHAFVNATVGDMRADMVRAIGLIREVNPAARIVLTVSPVAIIATYEPRHVLVSNTFSKAALRVVADELSRELPDVFYFPSYEIVTAPSNAARYLSEDMRTINEAGVAHVMRTFMRHAEGGAAPSRTSALDIQREGARVSHVICDEERLDA